MVKISMIATLSVPTINMYVVISLKYSDTGNQKMGKNEKWTMNVHPTKLKEIVHAGLSAPIYLNNEQPIR